VVTMVRPHGPLSLSMALSHALPIIHTTRIALLLSTCFRRSLLHKQMQSC
jgi:hypothetical protein